MLLILLWGTAFAQTTLTANGYISQTTRTVYPLFPYQAAQEAYCTLYLSTFMGFSSLFMLNSQNYQNYLLRDEVDFSLTFEFFCNTAQSNIPSLPTPKYPFIPCLRSYSINYQQNDSLYIIAEPNICPLSGACGNLYCPPYWEITCTFPLSISFTPSASPSPTSSTSRTISVTRTTSPTISISPTPSLSVGASPSRTTSLSSTVTPSVSPSLSSTPTQTRTVTVTPTISVTSSVSITKTVTPTRTPSSTPTITITPTSSQTPSRTPSNSPSNSASISTTPTSTPTISVTPSNTPSNTPLPSLFSFSTEQLLYWYSCQSGTLKDYTFYNRPIIPGQNGVSCDPSNQFVYDVIEFPLSGGYMQPVAAYLYPKFSMCQWTRINPAATNFQYVFQMAYLAYGTVAEIGVTSNYGAGDTLFVYVSGLTPQYHTIQAYTRGEWFHTCFTYQNVAQTFSVWVNGSQIYSASSTGNTPTALGSQMYVGTGELALSDVTFQGEMEHVMYFNFTLSSGNINALYTNTAPQSRLNTELFINKDNNFLPNPFDWIMNV